ncbi:MAG TPA: 5'/3'-nucleotidase SurE [Candidatus Binatia bacterium]|nr:5'/3'-nucleotidase SurE [Candidatus Binatia bacterium]
MSTVLLTNDDGVNSPTLPPLAHALERFGEVRTVVPSTERSWIAKAISRFDPLVVRAVECDGLWMHSVSGTPADCVNLAVHSLLPPLRPDFVVSGVNLGLNYGLAFLLSSGTIGAAVEAHLAGLRAVAISMAIPADAYGLTGAHRAELIGEQTGVVAEVAADIVSDLIDESFPPGVDLFSVNLPAGVTLYTPRVVTSVTRCRYGRIFVPGPDGEYLHRFSALEAVEAGGDMAVVDAGQVAITPLCLDVSTTVPDRLRAKLERSDR